MSSEKFVDITSSQNRRRPRVQHTKSVNASMNKQCYMFGGNPITFDNRTLGYYKTARQCHIDPILNMEINDSISFKFKYQWDPYTGERLGIDPFGPLCFHPMSLVYHFYLHRLDGLWKNEVDTEEGVFEGYYDMLVGSGKDLEVVGRAQYTELYLFRLPILDCYLTPDHNKSFITMGPILNDQEIDEIEMLCKNKNVQEEFVSNFNHRCPSIKTLKSLYDSAIAKTITVPDSCRKQYIVPQHYYVDQLRQL